MFRIGCHHIKRFFFLIYFRSCNSTAKPPTTIKVLLVGGDWLQGAVLRHYVDLLGVRPPDWVNHIRFYIVPLSKFHLNQAHSVSEIIIKLNFCLLSRLQFNIKVFERNR